MTATYLKRAAGAPAGAAADVEAAVRAILEEIEAGGDDAARACAARLDGYEGPALLSRDDIAAAGRALPETLKDDIRFAAGNIARFAEAQKASVHDFEIEVVPGVVAGQRQIPCAAAGCYVPGGRYAHVASALMTATTARVAGVGRIVAASPPRPGEGVHPAVVFAADLCGAEAILAMGGVQAIAAMAFGLFGLPAVDVLAGPGNQYVAEAKRMLYGRVGIDMVAGPTDSLILADETADPELVAVDLVGQAEHGWNSPVWLCTTDPALGEQVIERVPRLIDALPEVNALSARAAWRDLGEVLLCDDREAMAAEADRIAPEHLSVHAADLDDWLTRLHSYGSLFLGQETTVAFGDKASGPNHVLPTSRAARYTGGLSVHKFIKTVTWQRGTREGLRPIAEATARISRHEGMEGHARSADLRLARWEIESARAYRQV